MKTPKTNSAQTFVSRRTLRKLEVTPKPLGVGLDWSKLLYLPRVSTDIYSRLETIATREPHQIKIQLGSNPSDSVKFKITRKATTLVLETRGVAVVVRHPDSIGQGASRYGAELEIKGSILSAVDDTLVLVEQIRSAVEDFLYGDVATGTGLRARLGPQTLPGRFDLRVDVEISGKDHARFRDLLFACDVDGDPRSRWVTTSKVSPKSIGKAKSRDGERHESRGAQSGARTVLFAGKLMHLKVYEKSFAKTTRETTRERWRRAGWDGESPVLRAEWQAFRDWLREQTIGGRRGTELTFDEFLAALPAIGRRLAKRYRHTATESNQPIPGTRRRSSPWWWVVREALRRFETVGTPSDAWAQVRSVQRAQTAAHARTLFASAVAKLVECGRRDGIPLGRDDLHGLLDAELDRTTEGERSAQVVNSQAPVAETKSRKGIVETIPVQRRSR